MGGPKSLDNTPKRNSFDVTRNRNSIVKPVDSYLIDYVTQVHIVGESDNEEIRTMTDVSEVMEHVILAVEHILLIISVVKRQF